MLWTMAPRTVASLELRVFSVTARQCVNVLSDSSYSLRWKSAFASESSCAGAGRGHGERQPGDAEGPGGCEGEREQRLVDARGGRRDTAEAAEPQPEIEHGRRPPSSPRGHVDPRPAQQAFIIGASHEAELADERAVRRQKHELAPPSVRLHGGDEVVDGADHDGVFRAVVARTPRRHRRGEERRRGVPASVEGRRHRERCCEEEAHFCSMSSVCAL